MKQKSNPPPHYISWVEVRVESEKRTRCNTLIFDNADDAIEFYEYINGFLDRKLNRYWAKKYESNSSNKLQATQGTGRIS